MYRTIVQKEGWIKKSLLKFISSFILTEKLIDFVDTFLKHLILIVPAKLIL